MSKLQTPFQRPQAAELARRLAEPRRFVQVVAGPRQVGKSTLVQQVTEGLGAPARYAAASGACQVFYCRERNHEVDFVVKAGRRLTAIEVKSGRAPLAHAGTAAFVQAFKPQRTLLVGGDGVPVGDFLLRPVMHWVGP